MADAEEGTYEHACMRAELLGLPVPDLATFQASSLASQQRRSANDDEEHEQELEEQREEERRAELGQSAAQGLEQQKEDLGHVSGGLDELNNILSMTQIKINKFKTVCGSIKSLFSLRGSMTDVRGEGAAATSSSADPEQDSQDQSSSSPTRRSHQVGVAKQAAQEMDAQLSSQADKLDAMLAKAESAEMSMSGQNKQMRAFLR